MIDVLSAAVSRMPNWAGPLSNSDPVWVDGSHVAHLPQSPCFDRSSTRRDHIDTVVHALAEGRMFCAQCPSGRPR